MGGWRGDGKLLESLQQAVEVLYEQGYEELSNDVEEAISRLLIDPAVENPINPIIESYVKAAVKEEREACAKIAYRMAFVMGNGTCHAADTDSMARTAQDIAESIRKRG